MFGKIFKFIVLCAIVVGIGYGVVISINKNQGISNSQIENDLLEKLQVKPAEATAFFTYGKSFGLIGKITNIDEDNFENAKLYITNGNGFEKQVNLDTSFTDTDLIFSLKEINSCLILDDIDNSKYYILLRLKLNNSVNPRFYSFVNSTNYSDLDYITFSDKEKGYRRATVHFEKEKYKGKEYSLLYLQMKDADVNDVMYDVVIDAGHGGKDSGEVRGKYTEANITLKYAKALKEKLDAMGYKTKLTRDESNTDTYTSTNMYDSNGRISIACESKAKLMISFHVNNDALNNLTGFEIYSPSRSDLTFAGFLADSIKQNTSVPFSNNTTFKMRDGVYVRNYTTQNIRDYTASAKRKGYEPYPITLETPFLYTIREVGGVAIGAYVDGRNKEYSKNMYFDSNHGIECYQIELGYIKNDVQMLESEIDAYTNAIASAIDLNY